MSSSASAAAAGKRIKIRAPRKESDADYQKSLDIVLGAIEVIHAQNASLLSFEEIYRNTYQLTLHRRGDLLYQNIKRVLRELLQARVNADLTPAMVGDLAGDHAQLFLDRVAAIWSNYTVALKLTSDVFMYFDKNYCSQRNTPTSWELGLLLFRDQILRSTLLPVRSALRQCLLDQIRCEREGNRIDISLMRKVIQMLVDVGDSTSDPQGTFRMHHPTLIFGEDIVPGSVYAVDFERAFLAATDEHYAAQSKRLLAESDIPQYLATGDAWLRAEHERVDNYVHKSSRDQLLALTARAILADPADTVLAGVANLVAALAANPDDSAPVAPIVRAYRLYGRVDTGRAKLLTAVANCFRELGKRDLEQRQKEDASPAMQRSGSASNVSTAAASSSAAGAASSSAAGANGDAPATPSGAAVAAAAADPNAPSGIVGTSVKWVTFVVSLTTLSQRLLDECFEKNPDYERGLQVALDEVVNSEPRNAEYLSQYFDYHLKKGLKQSEAEIEARLRSAHAVFRFLQSKDTFEKFYNQHLARRLLRKQSANDDWEQQTITSFRTLCGNQFTARFEKMIQDMATSHDMSLAFDTYRRNKSESGVAPPPALTVQVLTSAMWPVTADGAKCVYPAVLAGVIKEFETFYASKHTSRTLTWLPQLGTADVAAYYKQKKELSVTTYAMVVLLLFNRADAWKYEDLVQETGIPEPELKRTLQSLSVAKIALLTKSPATRAVNPGDTFAFNANFSDKRTKLKVAALVAAPTRGEADTERAATLASVEEERRGLIDATIVRVMKARNTLGHNELITETVRIVAARFQPSTNMIKRRIEDLIDREYLARSEADNRTYTYVA
ncbi:hypothetical protein H9P43_003484 [Blastocladiella emersonii ATCC 22665]|nr:hypothetical protein H9P43_003484 [Blastocladiella emersonii ATCC 22665]